MQLTPFRVAVDQAALDEGGVGQQAEPAHLHRVLILLLDDQDLAALYELVSGHSTFIIPYKG